MAKQLRFFLISTLLVIVVTGCGSNLYTSSPASAPTTPAKNLELGEYFHPFTGAFVLYDLNSDSYIRYNPERCSERFLPASTFKILNSLIGLETGVIPDENYVIKWDGTQYGIPSLNQDHTLKTAMQNSVVWYYQELARDVGKERMQQYVDAVGYGNQDLTGPIDNFWLDGTLQISAEEQVEFLRRLYGDDLPFSVRSQKIVREILILEQTDRYQLSGKTGSGLRTDDYIGWFIGYLEKNDNVYFFATNIQGPNPDAKGPTAREITLNILQSLALLP
jgi:beta-lactamase class D